MYVHVRVLGDTQYTRNELAACKITRDVTNALVVLYRSRNPRLRMRPSCRPCVCVCVCVCFQLIHAMSEFMRGATLLPHPRVSSRLARPRQAEISATYETHKLSGPSNFPHEYSFVISIKIAATPEYLSRPHKFIRNCIMKLGRAIGSQPATSVSLPVLFSIFRIDFFVFCYYYENTLQKILSPFFSLLFVLSFLFFFYWNCSPFVLVF